MAHDEKEYEYQLKDTHYQGPLDVTMGFIGGKWKALILWKLRRGKKRFSEIRQMIPGITEKMLSIQLKALEQEGMLQREVFAEVPPRVEYSLSSEGESMHPCTGRDGRLGSL
ncbi:MAG: helix-turn-helix domain-containing protein [Owenweeksia sp.]|nr:helix-turn-helix domain-containing protein [Owenweeksia sp.]